MTHSDIRCLTAVNDGSVTCWLVSWIMSELSLETSGFTQTGPNHYCKAEAIVRLGINTDDQLLPIQTLSELAFSYLLCSGNCICKIRQCFQHNTEVFACLIIID